MRISSEGLAITLHKQKIQVKGCKEKFNSFDDAQCSHIDAQRQQKIAAMVVPMKPIVFGLTDD